MKKAKRIYRVIFIIVILLIAGISSYFFLFQKKAEVIAVSILNQGEAERTSDLIGTTFDSESQKIMTEGEKRVKKILVREGESVEEGTSLLQYDVRSIELAIAKGEVKMQQIKNKMDGFDHEIKRLEKSQQDNKKELIEEQKKQKELSNLELKKEQMIYEQNKKERKKGTVYSQYSGVVKSVKDPSQQMEDPVIEISGGAGIKVSVELPECFWGKVEAEDELTINQQDQSNSYQAKVISIDPYPSSVIDNVSYYKLTAFIEQSGELEEGSEVQVHLPKEEKQGIWIEKAYIREENGKKYVLKENKKGRLEKAYIKIGNLGFDMTEEVVEGLKDTDFIAFPYGKSAKEGIRTQKQDMEGN